MIRENQRLLNLIHVLSDGIIVYLSFPAAFWVRFNLMRGIETVPLRSYLVLAFVYTLAQIFTYVCFGLYRSFRRKSAWEELTRLLWATLLDTVALQSLLFLSWGINYSRLLLFFAFLLIVALLGLKRIILRGLLKALRKRGYNQKRVLLVGAGAAAERVSREIQKTPELGYTLLGYISDERGILPIPLLGDISDLPEVLERERPDEVLAALEGESYDHTGEVVAACDGAGVRLSLIPFYSEFLYLRPQFDQLGSLPLLNIRRVPLDNWANAFIKRAMDIACSSILLILLSPVMLICAAGVKLSSPGPVLFKQTRVGKDRKNFTMYKFRSMRVNDRQDTSWSSKSDNRRTSFGSFLRKFSLDELPQLWNVLKGDMSLVGPRPELPHFVEEFRREVPLYMVKHQVRPGITGWAQVNGFRGDTSIAGRIEHDIHYIENWSLGLDIKILFMTVFGGKFVNDEQMSVKGGAKE